MPRTLRRFDTDPAPPILPTDRRAGYKYLYCIIFVLYCSLEHSEHCPRAAMRLLLDLGPLGLFVKGLCWADFTLRVNSKRL